MVLVVVITFTISPGDSTRYPPARISFVGSSNRFLVHTHVLRSQVGPGTHSFITFSLYTPLDPSAQST